MRGQEKPLRTLIEAGQPVAHHEPFARAVIDAPAWNAALGPLANGGWSLIDLWAEPQMVHMALRENDSETIGTVSLACPASSFPSIARGHPPASRLERAITDLYGMVAVDTPDPRPWLDHGCWGLTAPLGAARGSTEAPSEYAFLEAHGDNLHQIAVGPVHAGIIEPGHFRFWASGETIVRLEQRLGYTHKGIEGLMAGSAIPAAARLAGRTSGDSTVAYALAFAQAVEAALAVCVPQRAIWLRALMAELERLANHLGDIGAICNDAAFALMHAHCAILRERILRWCGKRTGHRLMRDRVVPGGAAIDLDGDGQHELRQLLAGLRGALPPLVELYDNTASLQDRTVGTGIVSPELARQYGAGGFVGRASGRRVDARRSPGYAPYEQLAFEIPCLDEGDVNARVWIRIHEVEQSLALLEQILDRLPDGPIRCTLPERAGPREGAALIEGFRGEIMAWLRIGSDNRIERCRLRDPSWFQWPLLEAAIEGNIVADFPICNKSFNCSYSGHDL